MSKKDMMTKIAEQYEPIDKEVSLFDLNLRLERVQVFAEKEGFVGIADNATNSVHSAYMKISKLIKFVNGFAIEVPDAHEMVTLMVRDTIYKADPNIDVDKYKIEISKYVDEVLSHVKKKKDDKNGFACTRDISGRYNFSARNIIVDPKMVKSNCG